MNRNLLAALAALGTGAIGFGAGSLSSLLASQPGTTLKLVNTKLVRVESTLVDGGTSVSWQARSCGYLMPADGGRQLAEPCWDSRLDAGVFDAVESALLSDALSGD